MCTLSLLQGFLVALVAEVDEITSPEKLYFPNALRLLILHLNTINKASNLNFRYPKGPPPQMICCVAYYQHEQFPAFVEQATSATSMTDWWGSENIMVSLQMAVSH